MSFDSELFNVSPYYDDFNEDKRFLRMLFRPGYAVQSRELTQLQTILQNQIEMFGDHIFKDGSVVIGGQISTQTLNFIRLQPQSLQTAATPISKTLTSEDLVGYNIIQRDSNSNVIAKAKVVDFLPAYSEADNYVVAVISYMSGTEFSDNTTVEVDIPTLLYTKTATDSTNVPYKGSCNTVAVAEGIFYIDGFFVKTVNQIQPAYISSNEIRQFANPTGSMGFAVKSVILSERDDFTLRDPANGSYNYNAPGSHRYRIDLELEFSGVSDQENFFELVRYDNGEVIRKFDNSQYPELVKLFAQRTYDQSGNYIVKPFSITMKEKDENTLYAEIGGGKAYVYGHEYESAFKDTVEIPKARQEGSFSDVSAQNRFDNYVIGRYKTNFDGTGPFHTNIIPLFFQNDGSGVIGNDGSRPITVYGTTGGPISSSEYLTAGFSAAVFTALLHRMEMLNGSSSDTIFGADNDSPEQGVQMRAYLSSMSTRRDPISSSSNTRLNLYSIDTTTGQSTRLLFDLNTIRDTGESNSLLPKVNNFNYQPLIYSLNGDVPTTLISENEEVSYVHTVFRTFPVVPGEEKPLVSVNLGSNTFKWCTNEGSVPGSNQEFPIDEGDEYYLIFVGTNQFSSQSGTPPVVGEILRIALPGTPNRTQGSITISYPNATITSNGTHVKFTKNLKYGQWALVGKVKADAQTFLASIDTKIRTKTLAQFEQTISSSLVVNSRVINNNPTYYLGRGSIYSVHFLLDKADVYNINSIVDANTNEDISYKFKFDSGQRASVYGRGRLYVKAKYLKDFANQSINLEPSYNFRVNYSYFTHSGYGPFIKESYLNSGVSYENISVFSDPITGKSINLVNAIDFRPVENIIGYRERGKTAINQVPLAGKDNIPILNYSGGFIPSDYTIKSDYKAYLPRIDKIVVSKNIAADDETTTIRRIPGTASDIPQIPEDLTDSMTISILSVPAYTYNPEDVKPQIVANNKMTMKDMIDVSKRVDDLEQHVVVSDLETNVLYRDVKKSDGSDAIKRAILVDSFNGHSVGDVLNEDYRCSIDIEKGELKPSFESYAYNVEYIENASGITLTPDNILCESFTRYSTPVLGQSKASSVTEVNPFGFPNWVGNMTITPHGDFWFDRDFRPVVKYNDDRINDAWVAANIDGLNGHGTQWNDWESFWTGLSVELTEAESRKNAEFFARTREKNTLNPVEKKFFNKDGILRQTNPIDSSKNAYQLDFRKNGYYNNVSTDTIINTSVVPYMRDQILVFNAYNLKPGTPVYVFVDNVNMSDICYRYQESGATVDFVQYGGSVTGPFLTDPNDGSLKNVVLPIPRGVFEVGERLIRVTDDANNNVENCTTVAEAVFFCTGVKSQNTLDIQSVRTPEIRKQTPNSNKVVSTPLFKRKNINTIKYNNWVDPMAQTFEIRDDVYPNGFFAESVDIYIASADEELPITVKICPVINGIPHTSVILPFSTVVKNPSELNVDPSTPTATTFKFSTPVFLSPGQYAIILHTNSKLYSVFTAKIGEKDLSTNERISSTFSSGSLFKSQNNSETTGENKTDLMFNLYRCQFDTTNNGSRIVEVQTLSEGSTDGSTADVLEDISMLQPNMFVFTPDEVSMTGVLETGGKEYFFSNGRNVYLSEVIEKIETGTEVTLKLNVSNNSNGMNTFMLDLDKTNIIAASYIISSSQDIETEATPFAFKPTRRRRRRVTSSYYNTPLGKKSSGPLITRLGYRAVPGATGSAAIDGEGVVGSGLSKRGRKKWTFTTKGFVPQFISNSLEDRPVTGVEDDDNSRYITRFATISNGLVAKELKVYFDANLPNGSSIDVYAKTVDSTKFTQVAENRPYEKMSEEPLSQFESLNVANRYSIDKYDFREVSYSLVPTQDFNGFSIKICMYTTDKTKVPTIKNLRVVAVE